MTPERRDKFIATLNRRQPDLSLITDQVHKGRNIAALIRTADAVGIGEIHSVEPKEGYRFRGTTQGSDRWVKNVLHADCESAICSVKAQGMKVYAAHFSDRAVDYRSLDYTKPCAFLMGSEKEGVSDEAAALADEHILIPMMGMVASLNVSTAAGIILIEAQNQRMQAGLYDAPRMPAAEFNDTLFAWGYGDLAKYCHDKGLEYPPVNEAFELLNPSDWYEQVRLGEAPLRQW